jgi:hypothetical protein
VLNTLAGRNDVAIISGDILFDGREPDANFYRKTGFVEQLDMHGLLSLLSLLFFFFGIVLSQELCP